MPWPYLTPTVVASKLPRRKSALAIPPTVSVSAISTLDIGVKYGHGTANGNEWSIRAEYYQQSGSVPREQIVGNQAVASSTRT